MYINIRTKFIITLIVTVLWSVICSIIEIQWYHDLAAALGPVIAIIIIFGIAFLPGIMICITLTGIILDKPRRRDIVKEDLEDITVLIAAYNEEAGIYETLASLTQQDYPKHCYIKVIDNNSKDHTKDEIFRAIKDFPQLDIEYMFEKKQGKFAALNKGLFSTKTKYVITFDADTYLYKDALLLISNAIIQESKNKEVGAVAGTVLVRNSRENLLTKMQEWEYFLSIAGIKRMQGLFQSVLVAQGAFSIYNTEKVQAIGGWKDSIGEDIVLTWELLSEGNRTYYEDCAIAFTNAPTELKVFKKQRARWARGMIEGFRHFKFKNCDNIYSVILIFTDLFLFVIDLMVTCVYIPGIVIAILFHNYLIVGPMTLLLFPLTLILFAVMLISEYSRVFKYMGLQIRHHWGALLVFILTYSIILSPTCVKGYIQEFTGAKRKWK